MSCDIKYIGYQMTLSEIVAEENMMLDDEENEIYFYTTPEIAKTLVVGWTNILKSKIGYTQINFWVSSIETRLKGHLPASDGALFGFSPEDTFETAVGNIKRGVLVSGEIIT